MAKPKVLSYAQLKSKKYKWMEGLPKEITDSLGDLTINFRMIIWGPSGNGKTNLLVKLLRILMHHGNILYISLEEGHEASMQRTAIRHLGEEANGKIRFCDENFTWPILKERMSRKRSEQFVVIDSIDYFDFDYTDYKEWKSLFPNKTIIFISHPKGKEPESKTAFRIKHDVPIKVRVEGYVAFVISRLKEGREKPIIIWEEGAKKYWGKKFKEVTE